VAASTAKPTTTPSAAKPSVVKPQAPPTNDMTMLTFKFYRNDGSFTTQFTLPLQLGGTLTFDPRDALALPQGWVGSATVSADGNNTITAAVQEERLGWDALGYSAVTTGATLLRLPLIFKAFNNWRTGVEVQNLGTVATTVTITYTRQDGVTFTETATINPLASATF